MRFVAREFAAGDPRDDLFAPATTAASSRVIDTLALKYGFPVVVADAVDAYYQAV